MNRNNITHRLSQLLIWEELYEPAYRKYWAAEVTLDYNSGCTKRVDFMKFIPDSQTPGGIERGAFHFYEVKSSVEDFFSKAHHTFEGDYGWYVMPESVYKNERVKTELDKANSFDRGVMHINKVGILVANEKLTRLNTIRRAKKRPRERGANELLFMMLRSAGRDRSKYMGFDKDGLFKWISYRHNLERGVTNELQSQ